MKETLTKLIDYGNADSLFTTVTTCLWSHTKLCQSRHLCKCSAFVPLPEFIPTKASKVKDW